MSYRHLAPRLPNGISNRSVFRRSLLIPHRERNGNDAFLGPRGRYLAHSADWPRAKRCGVRAGLLAGSAAQGNCHSPSHTTHNAGVSPMKAYRYVLLPLMPLYLPVPPVH